MIRPRASGRHFRSGLFEAQSRGLPELYFSTLGRIRRQRVDSCTSISFAFPRISSLRTAGQGQTRKVKFPGYTKHYAVCTFDVHIGFRTRYSSPDFQYLLHLGRMAFKKPSSAVPKYAESPARHLPPRTIVCQPWPNPPPRGRSAQYHGSSSILAAHRATRYCKNLRAKEHISFPLHAARIEFAFIKDGDIPCTLEEIKSRLLTCS